MEESIKSNLKIKALIILLIATLLLGLSTLSCTVKAADEELEVPVAEEVTTEETEEITESTVITPKLNSKIYFEGKTYKLPNKDKVRKEYAEGDLGCGIISIISKRAKHPVYVSGEGWINKEQIKQLDKYITLSFKGADDGIGLNSTLKVDGEFLKIESSNEFIIKADGGEFRATGNGTTTVNITKKDGEIVEALATVANGEFTISIPEKSVSGELSAKVDVGKKVTVEGSGAIISVYDNGIGVAAEAEVNLKSDEREIASATAQGSLVASKDEGIAVEGTSSQTINILEKLKIKLAQNLTGMVNKEKAEVSVGGNAELNDTEVASGEAGLSYTYGAEDPEGNLKASLVGNEIVNVEGPIKIKSTLKNLMAKLRAI